MAAPRRAPVPVLGHSHGAGEIEATSAEVVFDLERVVESEPMPLPVVGDRVLGLTITGEPRRCDATVFYDAEDDSGRDLDLWLVDPESSVADQRVFARNARLLEALRGQVTGLLRVFLADQDGRGAVIEHLGIGDASDIAALSWPVERRVRFATELVEIFAELHRRSLWVGTWWVGDVLLDGDLRPVVTRVVPGAANPRQELKGGVPIGCYVAPEVIDGECPDGRADVYVLGRVLQHLLMDEHPAPSASVLPKLDELADQPAGLTRIIRKCTASSPLLRYASAEALAKELTRYAHGETVGLSHPDVPEKNRSIVSVPPNRRGKRVPRRQAPTPLWVKAPPAKPEPKAPSRRSHSKSKPMPQRRTLRRSREAVPSRTSTDDVAPWNPSLVFAGGVLVASASAMAFFLATQSVIPALASILVLAGAATAAAGAPVPGQRPMVFRAVCALSAAALLHLVNPVPVLTEAGLRHGLASDDTHQRQAALRAWMAGGSSDLSGLDLRGMTLSGRDFAHMSLVSADLSGADLTGADLAGADLERARLDGAILNGTFLEGAFLDAATGIEQAHCDDLTKLPDDWHCHDGNLRRGTAEVD